jgi:hypothetical protein
MPHGNGRDNFGPDSGGNHAHEASIRHDLVENNRWQAFSCHCEIGGTTCN